MKFFFPFFALALAAFVAANWLPEDYEIFSLNDKLKGDLGLETTFYSWLKLEKGAKATTDEINKAYRKLSRALHPDKIKGKSKKAKKLAEERFQRLSLVGNILRDNSKRQRYDYFLKKGFPKWKGTGYYYSRFRPGFVLVLFLLYVIVGTFHFVSLKISRKQDFKRIAALKEGIKYQAWGGSYIPPLDGSSRKVQAPNGKEFMVSPTGDVSLIEESEEGDVLVLVDENDINVNPSLKETLLFKLPAALWNKSLGSLSGYKIDTTVVHKNTTRKEKEAPEKKKKKKSSAKKGEKVELPNGKVIYSRKK